MSKCNGKNCNAIDGVGHSPECIEQHEDAVTGVKGRCGVPMWMNGMPAGMCDNKAYGYRPASRMVMNYAQGKMVREDGRYDGFIMGLACPIHGGPKPFEIEEKLAALKTNK